MKKLICISALFIMGISIEALADDPPKTIRESYERAQENCDTYAPGTRATLTSQRHSWDTSSSNSTTENGSRYDFNASGKAHAEAGVNGAGVEGGLEGTRVGSSTDTSNSSTTRYSEEYNWECR